MGQAESDLSATVTMPKDEKVRSWEMIDFVKFPAHLQEMVSEKLTFEDYVRFSLVSKQTSELAEVPSTRKDYNRFAIKIMENGTKLYIDPKNAYRDHASSEFPYDKAFAEPKLRFNVDRIILKCQLTEFQAMSIVRAYENGKAKANAISYIPVRMDDPPCEADDFARIIQTVGATSLRCCKGVHADYLNSPVVQNLKRLIVCRTQDVTDGQFLRLRARELELYETPISGDVINTYIKQWIKGEREIDIFCVFSQIEGFNDIFTDITKEFIWSRWCPIFLGFVSHTVWKKPDFVYKISREIDDEVLYMAIRDETSVRFLRKNFLKDNSQLCFCDLSKDYEN